MSEGQIRFWLEFTQDGKKKHGRITIAPDRSIRSMKEEFISQVLKQDNFDDYGVWCISGPSQIYFCEGTDMCRDVIDDFSSILVLKTLKTELVIELSDGSEKNMPWDILMPVGKLKEELLCGPLSDSSLVFMGRDQVTVLNETIPLVEQGWDDERIVVFPNTFGTDRYILSKAVHMHITASSPEVENKLMCIDDDSIPISNFKIEKRSTVIAKKFRANNALVIVSKMGIFIESNENVAINLCDIDMIHADEDEAVITSDGEEYRLYLDKPQMFLYAVTEAIPNEWKPSKPAELPELSELPEPKKRNTKLVVLLIAIAALALAMVFGRMLKK